MTDQNEELCATSAGFYPVTLGRLKCSHQPSWLAYAQGHGGDITVDINQGEYLFIFTSGET